MTARPKTCRCGLFWDIRKTHGKAECPLMVRPYPSSAAAFAMGCTCKDKGNNMGKGMVQRGQTFYAISMRCPLHVSDVV